ncbi:MAG: hypothetical protein Q7T56_03365 [Nocardioidaceae bacterium]|nr:hypothetical protein [Nocardioidaceae bacterium]
MTTAGPPTTPVARHGSAIAPTLLPSLVPSVAVGAVCVVVATLTAGSSGLWGALLGAGLVVVFFTLSLVVLGAARGVAPSLVLVLALSLYVGKVAALLLAFVALTRAGVLGDQLDRTSLGVTVIAATLAWTVGEIVASVKQREPLYDLGEERR